MYLGRSIKLHWCVDFSISGAFLWHNKSIYLRTTATTCGKCCVLNIGGIIIVVVGILGCYENQCNKKHKTDLNSLVIFQKQKTIPSQSLFPRVIINRKQY